MDFVDFIPIIDGGGGMSFTEQLRKENDDLFKAIFNHPFVRGIAGGKLDKEQLIHYVKQDYEYLNAFIRIYGIAISKCSRREDMAMFQEQIGFILHSEVHPHQNFCREAGVTYEELQGDLLAPSAHHYIRHMLTVAHEGSLGEIVAALLPCPWTYIEIGQRLVEELQPQENHAFREWIEFYGKLSGGSTERLCELADRLAEQASAGERARMAEHFRHSCQLEYMFWDMAWRLETWPVASNTLVKG